MLGFQILFCNQIKTTYPSARDNRLRSHMWIGYIHRTNVISECMSVTGFFICVMRIELVYSRYDGFSHVYTHVHIIFPVEQSADGEGFSMFNAEKIIRHGYANKWKVKMDFLLLYHNLNIII